LTCVWVCLPCVPMCVFVRSDRLLCLAVPLQSFERPSFHPQVERNPDVFRHIVCFVREGHIQRNISKKELASLKVEAEWWGVPELMGSLPVQEEEGTVIVHVEEVSEASSARSGAEDEEDEEEKDDLYVEAPKMVIAPALKRVRANPELVQESPLPGDDGKWVLVCREGTPAPVLPLCASQPLLSKGCAAATFLIVA
jgi:hypothetical protein